MEEETKNKYLVGVIGALVGALVGAIPWILMYIFANAMYALLSMFIVVGSFYGYKLTKAKIDKKLPVILSITSFISISVTMFIIIPICLMAKEELPVSFENLQLLYQYDEFTSALLQDYVIALLFCILVAGSIIYNLNKQLKEGVSSDKIKILDGEAGTQNFPKEDIDKVKEIFVKLDATDKKNAVPKENFMPDLENEFGADKAKSIFNYLKVQQIIKKKSNNFYFSEKAQKNVFYRYGLSSVKTFIIVMALAIGVAAILIFIDERNNEETTGNSLLGGEVTTTYEVGENDFSLDLPDGMIILSDEQITYLFGADYLYADSIFVSEDLEKIIMVYTYNKADLDKEYTTEEFFKEALGFGEEDVEFTENEFAGKTFYSYDIPYEAEDGTKYVEQDYVYDAGDRFICMIFDSLENEPLLPGEIIK